MHILLMFTPVFFQNLIVSFFNSFKYKLRHSGVYCFYKEYYARFENESECIIRLEAKRRIDFFLKKSTSKSFKYKKYYKFKLLTDFPILTKDELVNDLDSIITINEKDAIASLTGGTTGASMKVLFTKENIQERHALLDHFRAQYGYKLGKKCAWFSGKNIVTERNLKKGICYRDDYINKIRFFSTFHITDANFEIYWQAFCKFAPEFIVGFPSSVYEICAIADSKGLKFTGAVKAFFPTAETLLPIHREVIGSVLGCKIADQYASSEGAPFILECLHGGLHIHPLTGVFEVVDENMLPAQEGEILVTSFTTEGTPLIRYRIGDRIKLADKNKQCTCGSFFPLVEKIDGRSTDYISSPTHGKVNLGNISNSTKDVEGIVQFQVIQNNLQQVDVLVVSSSKFTHSQQTKFISALTERFGPQITIDLKHVDLISKEKSGKFRIVKNLLV